MMIHFVLRTVVERNGKWNFWNGNRVVSHMLTSPRNNVPFFLSRNVPRNKLKPSEQEKLKLMQIVWLPPMSTMHHPTSWCCAISNHKLCLCVGRNFCPWNSAKKMAILCYACTTWHYAAKLTPTLQCERSMADFNSSLWWKCRKK